MLRTLANRSLIVCATLLCACHRLSPVEQKLVGHWQWTYLEGVGEMTLTRDHKIQVAFPESDGSGRITKATTGTWHLDDETLVLIPDQEWLRHLQELDPQRPVQSRTEVQRHRIVRLDDKKLVCEDRYTLERSQ